MEQNIENLNSFSNEQLILLHNDHPDNEAYAKEISERMNNALNQETSSPTWYFLLFVILFWSAFLSQQPWVQEYTIKDSIIDHIVFIGLILSSVWFGMNSAMEWGLNKRKNFWIKYRDSKK